MGVDAFWRRMSIVESVSDGSRLMALNQPLRRWRVAVGISLTMGCAEAPPERPNIILVVIDTLRADHVSHAGYARPTASGLDRLAERATFFSHALAPGSWTRPSVASILTGLFGARHGASRWTGLSPDVVALADHDRVVPLLDEGGDAVVHLHHEGARGVVDGEPPLLEAGLHRPGHLFKHSYPPHSLMTRPIGN